MKKILFFLTCFILGLNFAQAQVQTTFKVTDPGGVPVANANVHLNSFYGDEQESTNAQGEAVFSLEEKTGYSYVIEREGHINKEGDFVTGNEAFKVNAVYRNSFAVTIVAEDITAGVTTPVTETSVQIKDMYSSEGWSFTQTTPGVHTFYLETGGSYTFTIKRTGGYASLVKKIIITGPVAHKAVFENYRPVNIKVYKDQEAVQLPQIMSFYEASDIYMESLIASIELINTNRIYLPDGKYFYTISGITDEDENVFAQISDSITINSQMQNLDIKFQKITFQLKDETSTAGLPINGLNILLYSNIGSITNPIMTDISGQAILYLTPGTYHPSPLYNDPFEYNGELYFLSFKNFTINTSTTEVSLPCKKATQVQFKLFHKGESNPIVPYRAGLNISDGEKGQWSVPMDEFGVGTTNLLEGTYSYTVSHFEDNGMTYLENKGTFTVSNTPSSVNVFYNKVDFSLRQRGSNTLIPADDINITISDSGGNDIQSFNTQTGVCSAYMPEGNFFYAIKSWFEHGELTYFEYPLSPFSVNTHTQVPIQYAVQEFHLQKTGGVPIGAGVEGASLFIHFSQWNTFNVYPDANGTAKAGFPLGSFTYSVEKFYANQVNYAVFPYTRFVVTETHPPIPINYNNISLNVSGKQGEPLQGAKIELHDENGYLVFEEEFITDINGQFVAGVPNGTYEYSVSPNGYAEKGDKVSLLNTNKTIPVSYADYYKVNLTVLDNVGIAFPRSYIEIYDKTTPRFVSQTHVHEGDNGIGTFYLPNGNYYGLTTPLSSENIGAKLDSFVVNGSPVNKTIQFTTTYAVTFQIKDHDGISLSKKVGYEIIDSKGIPVIMEGATLANGSTTVNLPDGDYIMKLDTFNVGVNTYASGGFPFTVSTSSVKDINITYYKTRFTVNTPNSVLNFQGSIELYDSENDPVHYENHYHPNEYIIYLTEGNYSYEKGRFNMPEDSFLKAEGLFTVSSLPQNDVEIFYYPLIFQVKDAENNAIGNVGISVTRGMYDEISSNTQVDGSATFYLSNATYEYRITPHSAENLPQKSGVITISNQEQTKIIQYESISEFHEVFFNVEVENNSETIQNIELIIRNTQTSDYSYYTSYEQKKSILFKNGTYNYTMTVITKNGTQEKTGSFTVNNNTVTNEITLSPISFTLNKNSLILLLGTTETLVPTFVPAEASNVDLIWASNQPQIVTVNENGVLAAVASTGTAVITASTRNGKTSVTCMVSVSNTAKPVTGVNLNKSTLQLPFYYYNDVELIATINPGDAGNKNVSWKSSNHSIVFVNRDGYLSTLGNEGTAVITVTTEEGGFTASCTVTVYDPNKVSVDSVTLHPQTLTLGVGGGPVTLSAAVYPFNATNQTISWVSSQPAIASVNNGVVTPISVGKTVITVTTEDGSKTARCTVMVSASNVAVEGVSILPATISLVQNETTELVATVTPSNAINKLVSWTSNKPHIASVDQNGKIKANALGTALITVTTVDGGFTATCTVTVAPVQVTGITLNITQMSVLTGSSKTLGAVVNPSNASDQQVNWSSDQPFIATVAEGVVRGESEGTAIITATTRDGGYTAVCTVKVTNTPILISTVSVSKTSLTITKGRSENLTVILTPIDATHTDVEWTSLNPEIVSVNQNGKIIALEVGSAVIKVTTLEGGHSAYCTVTVTSEVVTVTGVTLNKSNLTLNVGESETLTATVNPTNATNKNVSWSSSNPTVATVDQSGMVTRLTTGGAVITVTTEEGNFTATCQLTEGVGIEELVPLTANIYPNPVQDFVYIEADELVQYISLYTIQGKFLKQLKPNSKKLSISMKEYPAGTYLIHITTAKGMRTNKIIIKK